MRRDRESIIIIDNETISLEKICRILGVEFNVIWIPNSNEVLRLLWTAKDPVASLSLKIKLRNCIQALKKVRNFSKNLPIIMITNHSTIELAEFCADSSTQSYFRKPFSPNELLRKIKEILSRDNIEVIDSLVTRQLSFMVNKGIEFIKKNYNKPITAKDVASNVCLSRNHFGAKFKKETGLTITRYINNLRIEKSKILIKEHPDLNLSIISEMVGLRDEYYFSRLFRIYTGMTPRQFSKIY
jgi:YesN/AraC family two-component response regulator